MPSTTLLTNIHALATMTESQGQPLGLLRDAAVLIEGQQITWVGAAAALPDAARGEQVTVIDLRDHLVLPGLVNTHHHLYQTLTRAVAQDAGLFDWLKTLYPMWLRLTSEGAYVSAAVGLAELALSGCTTSSDHLYLYPNDTRLEDTVQAAQDVGLRFHATRGSMSLGESQGGLPPDAAVQSAGVILEDSARVIAGFHDPQRFAMTRVALAPCSPFSVTTQLMLESARLARQHGVMLHTHLAETRDEDEFCRAMFGLRPLEYAQSVEWLGEDVWFAHGVHFSPSDAAKLGACGCGVAHCPSSNMRLGSGIAPIRNLLNAGVKVGLGVDGSASNDGSHLLLEARMALLSSRVRDSSAPQGTVSQSHLRVHEALWLATRGGAGVLGRDDIGQVASGYAADLTAVNLNRLEYAGASHDPLAAVVLCAPRGVDWSMVNGRVIVKDGRLMTLDLADALRRHRAASRAMIG